MSTNIKKLSELKPGDIFLFAGFRWVKLEDLEEGTKVIATDNVEDQAFDTEDRNNWKESTLRKYLNDDFLEYLYDEGAKPEDFLTIVSDLTSDDGLKDYGTSEDKIALITCNDYRKYRSLIPVIDGCWWTITPWSCNPSISYYVRHVIASGALDNSSACNGTHGVHPLCNLKSDTLVSFEEAEQEEKSKDNTIPDCIADKILTRGIIKTIKKVVVDIEGLFYSLPEPERKRLESQQKGGVILPIRKLQTIFSDYLEKLENEDE